MPGAGRIPNYLEDGIIDNLKNLLKLRSQNDIEIHIEFSNRGNKSNIKSKDFSISDFDTSRKGIFEEIEAPIVMILKIWFIEWN